jgi:hypothetical protein
MASNKRRRGGIQPAETHLEDRRESGHPGGGEGRTDEVDHSGVQPVSIPHTALTDAAVRTMAEWGQGKRGAAGYDDHGESELIVMPPGLETPIAEHVVEAEPTAEPNPSEQGELKQQPAGALPSGLIRHWRRPSA